MSKAFFILLILAFSTASLAQTSGTLKIKKEADAEILDTIEVMLGSPEIFKPKKFKYRPSPNSKVVVFEDYIFRKGIPDAFYVVTFPKTGSIQSAGATKDGKKHGKWIFYTMEGRQFTIRNFDRGELLQGSKLVTVGN